MRHYSDAVFDPQGNTLASVSVSVLLAGTNTLATIYSDDGITPTTNPLLTDNTGTFTFYIADGRYDLKVSLGTTTIIQRDVEIADITQGAATDIPWVTEGLQFINQGSSPTTPSSGSIQLYSNTSDKRLYYKDDIGSIIGPLTPGGSGTLNAGTTGNLVFYSSATQGSDAGIPLTQVSIVNAVIDGTTYAKTAAGINAAISAIGSGTPAVIQVPYAGNYSDAIIALGKSHKLLFGAGTYTIAGITGPDSSSDATGSWSIQGQGVDRTTLFLATSSNRDVITSPNFGTLTGGTNFFGVFHCTISDLTIDANKAGQSSGYGIRLYGRGGRIQNVHLQNAKNDGIFIEWGGTQSFTLTTGDDEWFITNVKTTFSGGNGLTCKVKSDTVVTGLVSYQNGAWGIETFYSMHLSQYNGYLNTSGGGHANGAGSAAGFYGNDNDFTTATGTGLLIDSTAGSNNLSNCIYAATGGVALSVGTQGNYFTGQVVNSTTAISITNAAANGNTFILTTYGNTTGPLIKFNGNGGDSYFAITGNGAGSMFDATPPSGAELHIDVIGVTNNPYYQVRTRTINATGWAPQLPQSNGVIAALDTAQNWSANQNFSSIDSIVVMDGVTYPFTTAGLQAAINDAMAGKGIVHAEAATSLTITSQINLGNNAGTACTLYLPSTGAWSVSITDGVSSGIRVFNNTSMIGSHSGEGQPFVIQPASGSSNMDSLVHVLGSTDTYVRLDGFMMWNPVSTSATFASGLLRIEQTPDVSYFGHLGIHNANGVGLLIQNACCGCNFDSIACDSFGNANGQPVLIQPGTGQAVNAIAFEHLSATHPGSGKSCINIVNSGLGVSNILFTDTYLESDVAGTDLTTPLIQLGAGVTGCTFEGTNYGFGGGSPTKYVVDITASTQTGNALSFSAPVAHSFRGMQSFSQNLINDHQNGIQIKGANSLKGLYSTDQFAQLTQTTFSNADPKLVLCNSDFEGTTSIPPAGWTVNFGTTASYETSTPAPNKLHSIKLTTTVQFGGLNTLQFYSVRPGDMYTFSYYTKSDGTGLAQGQIIFQDKNGAFLSALGPGTTTSTSWLSQSAIVTVPATAVSAKVIVQNVSAATSTVWFDLINVEKLSALIKQLPFVNVTPVTVSANTASDQNLMSATVNAGTMNSVGRTLRVNLSGVFSTPSLSTSALTVKVKLGSLTLLSMTSAALGTLTATNNQFNLTGYITTQTAGASASFEAHGVLTIDLGAGSSVADTVYGDTNTATVGTLDSTASQTLQVTIAFSNASGSNSATQRQLIGEFLN